jgi:hypothetical protein
MNTTAAQIASFLKIENSAIVRCEEWANVWFVVIAKKGARFVSKKAVKMTKLQLNHYGKRGIYAYLCPIKLNGSQIERGSFLNGKPVESNKEDYYKGKLATVEFDLSPLPSGVYEYKEAAGHKSSCGYLKIENGKITQEFSTVADLVDSLSPLPPMPELEGTARQVEWAENIRATAIRNGFPVQSALKYSSAKIWIDSREKLAKYGVK